MVASGQREDLTDNDSLRDLREPVAVFLSYTDKYKFEQYMSGERKSFSVQQTSFAGRFEF